VLTVAAGERTQDELGWPVIETVDSLTKRGAGTLVLDAANRHVGPTVVEAGILRLAATDALVSSPVRVDADGTLALASGIVMRSPEVRLAGGSLAADGLVIDRATGIASLVIDGGWILNSPAVAVLGGGLLQLSAESPQLVPLGGLLVDETSGGLLDVGAGGITIAAGGFLTSQLRSDLIAGRNGGGWDGAGGITSSVAAADSRWTVGYLVAADGSARVSVAAAGDSDLNGMVDVFDLVVIAGAGRYGGSQPADWSQGDMTYDGVANIFDLVAIGTAGAFGAGAREASLTAATAVPEPDGLLVTGLVVAACALKRRILASLGALRSSAPSGFWHHATAVLPSTSPTWW
jgi:autotransporter-associated beta strand protein